MAALPTLLEYCAPFARVGGVDHRAEEGRSGGGAGRPDAQAATLLGARLLNPIAITIPGLADDDRALLVARQQRPCPPLYPRAAAPRRKHPLGE